jgi:hypothetical protein
VVVDPRKHLALHSFHTCQETKANRVTMRGRWVVSHEFEDRSHLHQLKVVDASCGNCRPSIWRILVPKVPGVRELSNDVVNHLLLLVAQEA